jgi:hypothetical protein
MIIWGFLFIVVSSCSEVGQNSMNESTTINDGARQARTEAAIDECFLEKIELSSETQFCFNLIYDSLILFESVSGNEYYAILDTLPAERFDFNNFYSKSIKEFYEHARFIKAYLLKKESEKYLILIGQAKGATGIGVDNWSYRYYCLTEKSDFVEFYSISKTPFSFFLNKELKPRSIYILDYYPRPASGEVKLEYHHVQGRLVNEYKEELKRMNYNCPKLPHDSSRMDNGN